MVKHGGNIYDYKHQMLDFSANINPFGMPDSVKQAIVKHIEEYETYPDVENRELTAKLSEKHGISGDHIVCGNGAADLIFRTVIALKPKKALVIAPTFSEYEEALKICDCEIKYYFLKEENGFNIKNDIFDHLSDSLDMIFLCNPNNPTGISVDCGFVKELYQKCSEYQIVLAVDECFCDFLVNEEEVSVIPDLHSMPNAIVFRAFTKMYAMAGIRLGYALCGSKTIAGKIKATLQPWSVSTVASKCGIAALGENAYVARTKESIAANRNYLVKELKSLGMKVYDSSANYIFFRTEKNILKPLEEAGILIRNCENFVSLDRRYFRIAVKKEEENKHLVTCLKRILEVTDVG